jgi:multidrug resistance efflux pump
MQWPIFIIYTALIWLVFSRLRLLPFPLPVALFFASAGPIILFLILVAMNFYHPGTADVRMLQRVVQITPRISSPGRVAEVVVKPETRMAKGETLFRIDPVPFEFDVRRLEAALVASEQSVRELKTSLDQATAARARAKAQVDLAQQTYDRQKYLFDRRDVAQATVDTATRNLEAAEQAEAGSRAAEDRARLAYQSNIGDVNTSVVQAQQQLAAARTNLSETTVTAPCDGFVTNVNILPGAIVSAAASVMPFVCDQEDDLKGKLVATFDQASFLAVKPGEYAEVTFSMYPGQVFTGKVDSVIDITSGGTLAPSGALPTLGAPDKPRFAAVLKLDDPSLRLPAGAQGTGAVYTGKVQFAGMLRMGFVRTDAILNYVAWGT